MKIDTYNSATELVLKFMLVNPNEIQFFNFDSGIFKNEFNRLVYQAIKETNSVDNLTLSANIENKTELVGIAGQIENMKQEGAKISRKEYEDAMYFIKNTSARNYAVYTLNNALKKFENSDYDYNAGIQDLISNLINLPTGAIKSNIYDTVQLDGLFQKALNEKDEKSTDFITHIDTFDRIVKLKQNNVCVIAGRPGLGKTTFAMNLVRKLLADKEQKPIVMFQTEMSPEVIYTKLLSMITDTSLMSPQDVKKLVKQKAMEVQAARAYITNMNNFHLVDGSQNGLNLDKIKNVLAAYNNTGIGCIIIDYIQNLKATDDQNRRYLKRFEIIGEMIDYFTNVAKQFNCPVLVLAQLNREAAKLDKQGKEIAPTCSQIKDSGQIEQAADTVILLHTKERLPSPEQKFKQTFIVAKNRNNALAEFWLEFYGDRSLYDDPRVIGEKPNNKYNPWRDLC